MKVLVTGASGFLGKHVVAAALARGFHVKALIRPRSKNPFGEDQGDRLEIVRTDLRAPQELGEILCGVDVVIHLAAAKSGSFYAQFAGTVIATENLLFAMNSAGIKRMVLISTFSIYDYMKISAKSVLDENSSIETDPKNRDDYCKTKLVQEQVVRDAMDEGWLDACILRPGVIYGGPSNLWTARLGAMVNDRLWLRIGANAKLPLTYVENCANAITLAAEQEKAWGQTINIVDDECVTQRVYLNKIKKRLGFNGKIVPINYSLIYLFSKACAVINRVVLSGKAKFPGLFRVESLAARCKPLRYSNQRAKEVLGWAPVFGLDESIKRSISSD